MAFLSTGYTLISEDQISFLYEGMDEDGLLWVRAYKPEYLTETLIKRMVASALEWKELRHPGVLPLIDFRMEGGQYVAIYERPYQAVSLETYLKSSPKISYGKLWEFVIQLASALVVIEQAGLPCGGINFADLWISENEEIIVANGGLSLLVYQFHRQTWETLDQALFYPPEFFLYGHYSTRGDVYSFGILLYVMFNQKWPYPFGTKVSVVKKHLVNEPAPIKRKGIPERLKRVIDKCLDKAPGQRFDNVGSLIKAYNAIGGPGQVFPPESPYLDRSISMGPSSSGELRIWVKPGLWLGLAILFFGCLYGGYKTYMNSIPDTKVPLVEGLKLKQAEKVLEDAHLKCVIAGERVDVDKPDGTVLEAKPGAGRVVKEYRTIRLIVSKSFGDAEAPNLVGRDIHQAMNLAEARQMKIVVEEEVYSSTIQKDFIYAQSPSPNAPMSTKESLRVKVSKGFPVSAIVSRPKMGTAQIQVRFSVPPDWSPQKVEIIYTSGTKRDSLYNQIHHEGDQIDQVFSVVDGGILEIYFNNDSALKQNLAEATAPDDDAAPPDGPN